MGRHPARETADRTVRVVATMVALGFAEYEARSYAGLLGRESATGYEVAKATGIPQSKVYETLRKLARKGVVARVGSRPERFTALAPSELLHRLEADFARRLGEAHTELAQALQGESEKPLRALPGSRAWPEIVAQANDFIASASHHVYASAHAEQLADIAASLARADGAGVRVDLIHFGAASLDLEHGAVLRHRSTDGVIYRHHQGRHLALTADRTRAIWALSDDGRTWDSVWAEDDALLASVVRGYIRHDLYVQRIFADFAPELRARYGPSLHGLIEETRFPAKDALEA